MMRNYCVRNLAFVLLGALSVSGFAPITQSTATSRSSSSLNALEGNALLATLDTFYQTQPYVSAFVTCSIKASAADLVAQREPESAKEQEEQETSLPLALPSVDVKRNLAFLLYGGLYQGCVQQWLYGDLYPSLFGDSTSLWTVVEQVALDMTVLAPFLCLPMAYLVKGCVASGAGGLGEGLARYVEHVQEEGLLTKFWAIWVPVQSLTFTVIPIHLRIVFIAFISFFWLMILSSISARQEAATSASD